MPVDPKSFSSFSSALDLSYSNPDGVTDDTLNRLYDTSDYLEAESDPVTDKFDPYAYRAELLNETKNVMVCHGL